MEGNVCKKCGCTEFDEREKGPHKGLYCKVCGKWLKWVTQNTQGTKKTTENKPSTLEKRSIPVVKGTERLQIFRAATGELILNRNDDRETIYKPDALELPQRVVITIGDKQAELDFGESICVYLLPNN